MTRSLTLLRLLATLRYAFVGMDLLLSAPGDMGKFDLLSRPRSFVERLRKLRHPEPAPFVLAMNFVLPWGNAISYFRSGPVPIPCPLAMLPYPYSKTPWHTLPYYPFV